MFIKVQRKEIRKTSNQFKKSDKRFYPVIIGDLRFNTYLSCRTDISSSPLHFFSLDAPVAPHIGRAIKGEVFQPHKTASISPWNQKETAMLSSAVSCGCVMNYEQYCQTLQIAQCASVLRTIFSMVCRRCVNHSNNVLFFKSFNFVKIIREVKKKLCMC